MTITMSEAGLLELPEAVRRRFQLKGEARFLLDVSEGAITLRLEERPAEDVPAAKIENRGGYRVIAGPGPLSDERIIRAIQADRDEREERILAFRNEQ